MTMTDDYINDLTPWQETYQPVVKLKTKIIPISIRNIPSHKLIIQI